MRYAVFVRIDIETNDQPPADVRRRLSNAHNRVGQWIWKAAKDAAEEAVHVFSPETYYDNWPENGRRAEVVAVRQHTRRAD